MPGKSPDPTLLRERALARATGAAAIAGLDEAGRGALAGPVCAAAVILDLDDDATSESLSGVQDSKQLTANARDIAYTKIVTHSAGHGVGWASAEQIDEIGIISATKVAMTQALDQLDPGAEALLIDGRLSLHNINLPQEAIIRGDSICLSIAAASILAKVSRDRLMLQLNLQYPEYGFARHKGYGTEMHLEAIARFGPCPIHRLSFSPFAIRLV